MRRIAPALIVCAGLADAPAAAVRQSDREPLAIGVRYQPAADSARRQRDLEEIRRLHFAVVAQPHRAGTPDAELAGVESLLADANAPRVTRAGVTDVPVVPGASPSGVRLAAWTALTRGARTILFDDWAALERNAGALEEAAEFTAHLARNAALYGALRPAAAAPGTPSVIVQGGDGSVAATFLESPGALVLVASNQDGTAIRTATLAFSPETPEAIWQNMLTGAAVNFVAGPDGPTYSHAFAPHAVLVLMVRRNWR